MRASWGLTNKILTGEKSVETRWYKTARPPWGKVTEGDTIFFKDSGKPVSIKATAGKVRCISELNPLKVKDLLNEYCKHDGIAEKDIPAFYPLFKDKKYCMIVSLKNPKSITPFDIDKSAFGAMAAWITVSDVNKIKV
jgi:hypothetical protein